MSSISSQVNEQSSNVIPSGLFTFLLLPIWFVSLLCLPVIQLRFEHGKPTLKFILRNLYEGADAGVCPADVDDRAPLVRVAAEGLSRCS